MRRSDSRLSSTASRGFFALFALLLGAVLLFALSRSDGGGEGLESAVYAGPPLPADPPVVAESAPPAALAPAPVAEEIAPREPLEAQIAAALLHGRVRSSEGSDLEGVRVSWTAWDPLWLDRSRVGEAPPLEAVEARTEHATTRSDGRFFFEKAPPIEEGGSTILWLTHPSYAALSYELDPDPGSWPDVDELVMQPAPPIEVTVRENGAPTPGSEVVQRVERSPSASSPQEGGAPFSPATLVFTRTYRTDEAGRATVSPASFRHRLEARSADLASAPWVGASPARIHLELASTFELSGTVSLPIWDEGSWGRPLVSVVRVRAGLEEVLCALPISAEYHFGPADVPVLAADEYVVRLGGGPFAPEETKLPPPRSGENVVLDLQGKLGHPVWFTAVDEEGNPIPTARISARWKSDGRHREGTVQARGDGYILLPACPPGVLDATVSAPGYDVQRCPPIEIPEEQPSVYRLLLKRGSRIEGVCLDRGEPVADFEVRYWWVEDPTQRERVAVTGSADGRFEIESAMAGHVALVAVAADYRRSQTVTVDLASREGKEIVLNLGPPTALRGQVVDAATGEPLSDGRIQVIANHLYRTLDPIGPPFEVASDGSFELRRFGEGVNVLAVSAPGHSTRTVKVRGSGGRAIELGQVRLDRVQPLEVQLIGGEGASLAGYTLIARGVEPIPPRTFGADGTVRVDEVHSGAYELTLLDAERRIVIRARRILRCGEDWRLEFHLTGGSALTVQVVPEGGAKLTEELEVELAFQGVGGGLVTRYLELDREGRGHLSGGVGGGELRVWVRSPDGASAGAARRRVPEEAAELELVVPVSDRAVAVRVVDPDGLPVPGVLVELYGGASGARSIAVAYTDPLGECEFLGLPSDTSLALLMDPDGGVAHELPFPFLGGGGEVVELVLETSASIEVRLEDDGTPAAGLTCRLWEVRRESSLTSASLSDGAGRVRFPGLGVGDYVLRVEGEGYWPAERTLRAKAGGGVHAVEVRRLGGLELELLHGDGAAAVGTPLELVNEDLGAGVADWIERGELAWPDGSIRADDRGRIVFDAIPHGSYRWTSPFGAGRLTVEAGTVTEERILIP